MNQIQHVKHLGTVVGALASFALMPVSMAQGDESGLQPRLVIEEVAPAIVQPVGGDIRLLATTASPVGLVGDQTKAALGSSGANGFLVWQDSLIDGDGTGIGSRFINLQTGVAGPNVIRVNQNAVGNQDAAKVAGLSGGNAVVVWQSGPSGKQSIIGRLLTRTGAVSGDEFVIASAVGDIGHAKPAVAALPTGGFVVVWEAFGQDGISRKIHVRQFDSNGVEAMPVRILGTSAEVDRGAAVAVHSDGKIVVAWVAEMATRDILNLGGSQTRRDVNSDIFVQAILPSGVVGPAVWVNNGSSPCDAPAVASLPNGKTLVGWSEFEIEANNGWDIRYTQLSAENALLSSSIILNTYRPYEQNRLSFAVNGTDCLAVWSSRGADGSGLGVVGRSIALDGAPRGDEIVFNATKWIDQMEPAVAATPSGYRIVWSGLTGISTGVDLAGREIRKASATGGRVLKLTWNTVVGGTYILETSENLVDWQLSQAFPAVTSRQKSVTLSGGAAASTYFRVKLDR